MENYDRKVAVMEGLAEFGYGFLMVDPRHKAAPFGIDNAEHLALFVAESNPDIEWRAAARPSYV